MQPNWANLSAFGRFSYGHTWAFFKPVSGPTFERVFNWLQLSWSYFNGKWLISAIDPYSSAHVTVCVCACVHVLKCERVRVWVCECVGLCDFESISVKLIFRNLWTRWKLKSANLYADKENYQHLNKADVVSKVLQLMLSKPRLPRSTLEVEFSLKFRNEESDGQFSSA